MLRVSLVFLLLAPALWALELDYPKLLPGSPPLAVIEYRATGEVGVEWQFSLDNGRHWRPMQERFASSFVGPSEIGWTARAGLVFPGDFPAGMSLRAKFTDESGAPQLSLPMTIPHRIDFPGIERVVDFPKVEGFGFQKLKAEGERVVAIFVATGSTHGADGYIETMVREAGVWVKAPRLDPPAEHPQNLVFGRETVLFDGQLFVGSPKSSASAGDGVVYVYDWSGPASGWSLRQTISRPDEIVEPFRPDYFLHELVVADGYLLVTAPGARPDTPEYRGSVYVFRRAENGDWQFDARLQPDSTTGLEWKVAYQHPAVTNDSIVTHGYFADGSRGTFYFTRTDEGWKFVEAVESTPQFGFTLGSHWCEVLGGWSEVVNGVGGEGYMRVRIYDDPGGPASERTLLTEGEFDYGFFPGGGNEDWLFFYFEPSYAYDLPYGAVALTPLHEGTLHPNPILLTPPDTSGYGFIGRSYALSGDVLYVASVMLDGSFAVDSVELTAVPHPRYPEVTFPVWLKAEPSAGLESLSLRYRASNNPAIETRVVYSISEGEWHPFQTNEANTMVLDSDPDGDNAVTLYQTIVPATVDGQAALYRVIEQPLAPR